MATTAIVQSSTVQHASKKKKKPGTWKRVRKSFVTSIYITHFWEWFLGLAGRLVAPVLFFTIMYNVAETYPGFSSPWAWIGQAAFMLQNGALDIGSFGLPKLADQAEQDGNREGAKKARDVGQALFWIMISNLVWGGIEHVIGGGMPDGVKTFVALVFLIVRAYYAISYTKVIHSMKKEEADEEEESVQEVDLSPVAPAIDYAALVDLLKPHLEQIRSSLAVDLKPVVPALDYVALALAVAPHIEARSTTQVALSPVGPALAQVDLMRVALASTQVDLSPVEPALASTQVDLSPVPPKEPGPEPLVKARSSGSQVDLESGSELEKSRSSGSGSIKEPLKAGPVTSKSSNEERDRKLAEAYAAMVAESAAISGRTLAARAKCARPAATEWLRLLLQVAPGGSESGSGSGTSGLEATGSGSNLSGSEEGGSSGLEATGSNLSGPGSSGSKSSTSGPGSDEVDLKPRRSRVRNTDELVALDLEVDYAQ